MPVTSKLHQTTKMCFPRLPGVEGICPIEPMTPAQFKHAVPRGQCTSKLPSSSQQKLADNRRGYFCERLPRLRRLSNFGGMDSDSGKTQRLSRRHDVGHTFPSSSMPQESLLPVLRLTGLSKFERSDDPQYSLSIVASTKSLRTQGLADLQDLPIGVTRIWEHAAVWHALNNAMRSNSG